MLRCGIHIVLYLQRFLLCFYTKVDGMLTKIYTDIVKLLYNYICSVLHEKV